MERIDSIVVGAGVVGLAVARALACSGRDTVVLEAADSIGTGTSSRNSEVIHAGIYYPTGSRKAALCVRGRRLLYDYCASRGVAHRRVGKLLVATDAAQRPRLAALREQSVRNGLTAPGEALVPLDAAGARAIEPQVRCVEALWSPATGILDSHALMLALLGDAERAGAALACGTHLEGARRTGSGFVVRTQSAHGAYELACAEVVDCAGLAAQAVARRIEGLAPETIPAGRLVKGSYFSLSGCAAPFSHLVYPMPDALGLGVHATVDLAGQVRFGPDTEPVESPDYRVDAARAAAFYACIRQYWPALPDGALAPAYAGVRPKLAAADADFAILGPADHGLAGFVGLYGIESPGLTASLAIAEDVLACLQ